MGERRKFPRFPLRLELMISSLFKQDYESISGIDENIEIKDISKSGIGFYCKHELPLNYYFDAKIHLTDDKFFCAVLKIIRVEKADNGYFVGCEFVGLADILSMRVDLYSSEMGGND